MAIWGMEEGEELLIGFHHVPCRLDNEVDSFAWCLVWGAVLTE